MDELPVEASLPELREALDRSGHAVLQAEPGAGKTTVVPLRLLDEPWLDGRRIVVLEPRRVATRAAARRMASLLGEEVGETVGYRTRDDRRTGPRTRIEVVTEGILTRRLQHDPGLEGVGCVVFDEFHERSLPGDLGLALAIESRSALRPDLRLLVMSATLDGERVAGLLGAGGGPAPVVTSEGRAHPVEVRWRPRTRRDRMEGAVAGAVREALRDTDGDLLVFLPGAGEIRRVGEALARLGLAPDVDVLELHGSLPAADQDAAIGPALPGRRKVVLSTDIAETSLTVAGVRAVVDLGEARVPRFDPRTGMSRLTTVPASRASADQRAGRAGRLGPGLAIRLWSKVEHAARRAFTEPEITQVDLAPLALELAVWGARDATGLHLLDPPPAKAFEEGRRLLHALKALDGDGAVTPLGRRMAELPLHPRLARMVLVAQEEHRGWLACLLAALLEDRDVLRGRPDDLPADLGVRLELLADPAARHEHADGRALRRARQRAADLAARAGVTDRRFDAIAAGGVLALAYPDRIAQQRPRSRGRFVLRGGTGAWLPPTDQLAGERFLVAADLDGHRKEARMRLAAPLDELELLARFGDEISEQSRLEWDRERDDLVARVERRLDRLTLGGLEGPPEPGEDTLAALVARARSSLDVLGWSDQARQLQQRIAFLRSHQGDRWPDVSDGALRRTVEDWLPVLLPGARGRADLERVDMGEVLRGLVGHDRMSEADRLAPPSLEVPSGRKVRLDWSEDPPVLAVAVQELYGSTATPAVLGGAVPVKLHLLSPAGRPVQITSDLAGFWAGSWKEVRKEMAGRYPKHRWPEDPASALPG